MKKTNIKTFLICISFSLLFFSCLDNDNDPETVNPVTYSSLNDVLEALKPEPQVFTVNPTIEQIKTGADGTIVQIFKDAFTDADGNLISTPVTMTLTEYLTLEDIILGNVQTSSNNQLLVTGGSLNVTFEDENGASVNSNPWDIQAVIPVQTDITGYENQMRYYEGETTTVDGREVVNWDLAQNSEAWIENSLFNIFGLRQGLANCDVLYNMAADAPTQFEVTVSDVTDYTETIVWLIIEDFPSVVMINSLNDTMTALKTYDNSIPTGINATLLAITVDADSYLKFGSLPITVLGDDTFNINIDYGTTEELTALVQSITN